MTTRPVVIEDEKDGAFNRVSAEHEGSIYPNLIPVLDTYVRTRCIHSERGIQTAVRGDVLCDSCSEEVLANLALCVGSGDVDFSQEARSKLDAVCALLPETACKVWEAHGGAAATQEQAECATSEIAELVTFAANTVRASVEVQKLSDELKKVSTA